MKLSDPSPAQQLFQAFCRAYKERDMQAFLALFAKDINMWGTGVDECRKGLIEVEAQLRRDWSQSEAAEIVVDSIVPVKKGANWFAAVCKAKITVDGVQHVFHDLRGTIVIAKENGEWKITHMHASFPDARNTDNNSFPVQ